MVEEIFKNTDLDALKLHEAMIKDVMRNKNIFDHGFVADIRDNGTIVLRAGNKHEMTCHSLSKSDSIKLLTIIMISINDQINEIKLNEGK